jgi:hypothetical protein
MTTLTSSATLTVGAGATAIDSITLSVLPAIGTGTGKGRLIHPGFNGGDPIVYDYPRTPDEYTWIDAEMINPPIWGSSKTFRGASSTLYISDIQDPIREERWVQSIVSAQDSLAFVRMMIAMWVNAPDPTVAYVQWFPNYISQKGFNVILLGLTVGTKEITLTSLSKRGLARGPMTLTLRVVNELT